MHLRSCRQQQPDADSSLCPNQALTLQGHQAEPFLLGWGSQPLPPVLLLSLAWQGLREQRESSPPSQGLHASCGNCSPSCSILLQISLL